MESKKDKPECVVQAALKDLHSYVVVCDSSQSDRSCMVFCSVTLP